MKKHLIIILLAIVSLFLGMNGFAQERKGPEKGHTGSKPAEGEEMNAFMVDKIIGSKVINLKGETLGKIEDLVVDIDTGSIVYAILDSGGFLGIGGKLVPVPWKSLLHIFSQNVLHLLEQGGGIGSPRKGGHCIAQASLREGTQGKPCIKGLPLRHQGKEIAPYQVFNPS